MLIWTLYYFYFFCQILLLFFAFIEFSLLIQFLKPKKKKQVELPTELPKVLIQLPIYNEQYVIGRLIHAVSELDYPKELLYIQVLDDSTDESVEVVRECVAELQGKGFNIEQVIRGDRSGFKAGALAYGMTLNDAPFIAIFDADFVPSKDFLRQTLPPFYSDPKIGLVQTRWSHINENQSLLTKVQATFLNTHFTVEQAGRNNAGAYINFNGTAGIWRRQCIEEGGGWQADTLTEDLDLSFRAQMKGWKFEYLLDITSPAELPATLPAFKVQQFRWAKGAAECSRKNLKALFATKDLGFFSKIIGALHLLNSAAFIVIVALILMTIPMAFFFADPTRGADPFGLLNFTYLTTFILFLVALLGNIRASENKWSMGLAFPFYFFSFLITSMGISLYLMIGVIEGFAGKKSAFIRTPKFNLSNTSRNWKGKKYSGVALTPVFLLEVLLLFYCFFSLYYTFTIGAWPLFTFVAMYTTGLAANIISNVIHRKS